MMDTDAMATPTNGDLAAATNDFNGGVAAKGISSRPGSAEDVRPFEPMQTATPPTTGSPMSEDPEKLAKRQAYAGMSADRMRQLGLLDGASE